MNGILFKPWKVRAIAANPGKGWQTRRMIKGELANYPHNEFSFLHFDGKIADFAHDKGMFGNAVVVVLIYYVKPQYRVGEVVYIKEAWRYFGGEEYEYCKDPRCVILRNDVLVRTGIYKWHNPRTMPAWAARHFIKITRVEPCRIRDITFEDCLAEGVVDCPFWQNLDYKAPAPLHPNNLSNAEADREIDRGWIEYARQVYFALWEDINGKGSLSSNPWAWKYTFVKVDKPVGIA